MSCAHLPALSPESRYLTLPDFFQTPANFSLGRGLSGLIWVNLWTWNLSSVGNVKGFLLGLLEEDPGILLQLVAKVEAQAAAPAPLY